jgi:hypothetical protein
MSYVAVNKRVLPSFFFLRFFIKRACCVGLIMLDILNKSDSGDLVQALSRHPVGNPNFARSSSYTPELNPAYVMLSCMVDGVASNA